MTRLLFVTRNFPPLVGGMERLALESVRALAHEWEVDLVGPKDCEAHAPASVQAVGINHRSGAAFLASGLWQAVRLAKPGRHGAIVGGSGLAAPLVIAAAKRVRGLRVCFVHGLDLVVDSAIYRALCLPALRAMDLVLANSHNTAALAGQLGIRRECIQVLHPGVSIDPPKPPDLFLAAYPEALDRPLLLSVGRLLPRKGVAEFVERVLPIIVRKHPRSLLVIAGGEAKDALVRADNGSLRVQRAVEQAGLSQHVLLTGQLNDDVLDSLYAAARLLVFPVQDLPHDVEGFGMVALEAAAHGLPTIAFAAGGVSDAVRDGVSGTLVPPGDYVRMADVISQHLEGDVGTVSAESCRAFAAPFNWSNYADGLRDSLRSAIASQGGQPA